MQANGLHGPIHGARIGSKLPPLPPSPPAAPPEPALPADGVVLSASRPAAAPVPVAEPPAPSATIGAQGRITTSTAPVVSTGFGPQFMESGGVQFFSGAGSSPAQAPASHAPKTLAEIRAESDREVNAILSDMRKSTLDTTQRWIDSSRGGGSSPSAPAPAAPPPAPSLSASQKKQIQQLVKSGVNADFARRLVESNDQFKIRLLQH